MTNYDLKYEGKKVLHFNICIAAYRAIWKKAYTDLLLRNNEFVYKPHNTFSLNKANLLFAFSPTFFSPEKYFFSLADHRKGIISRCEIRIGRDSYNFFVGFNSPKK